VPSSDPRPDCDLFCQVIDNFGDIGVCWRLARQLAAEHHLRVRLWVDDLATFKALWPAVATDKARQQLAGVDVRRWDEPWPAVAPGHLVLETFACRLPEAYLDAMARTVPPPVWLNLDHLSAEDWVATYHALPSPHPRLPLVKHFFFPGFTAGTGGLLRESDLEHRRTTFLADDALQTAFWRELGQPAPVPEVLRVSLFAYHNPALPALLRDWQHSRQAVCCLAPAPRDLETIAACVGRPLRLGEVVQCGALEIRVLPFLDQERYDRLLWLCDINFVRGEDSFVRAQWAAQPLIWQIYPQTAEAHLVKLAAFMNLYWAAVPEGTRNAIHTFWQGWNSGRSEDGAWNAALDHLAGWRQHAERWQQRLLQQDDLASTLLRFARSKV